MPHETRRETVADTPVERTGEIDDSDIKERLQALGYS
jgi:hypothetical protein